MRGLERICKLYGRMQCGDTLMVWDYANEVAVPESKMPRGSQRWSLSEKIKHSVVMDNMNAKDLFKKRVDEADELPGDQPPNRPPLRMSGRKRTIPLHQPGSEMGEEGGSEDIARMMGRPERGGRPEEPPGQFSKQEISQLKDVMILILAHQMGSDTDKAIGAALAAGQPLDPGQLQHILDEARRANLPKNYNDLMQKIYAQKG